MVGMLKLKEEESGKQKQHPCTYKGLRLRTSEKLTFLHTCDLHLDEAHPDRLEVLRWLLEAAAEREAALFICGDLFDSGQQARALRPRVRDVFNSYPSVEVFVLPGNHDWDSYSGGEDYGASVRMLSATPVEIFNHREITLVAAPFVQDSGLASALSEMPAIERPAILLAHGTCFGSDRSFQHFREEVRRRGEEDYPELGVQYFPIYPQGLQEWPFSYVALGHFHGRYNYFEEERIKLCYPGSPTPITKREIGIRKAALVTIDPQSRAVEVNELIIEEGNHYLREEFHLLPCLEESTFSKIAAFLEENADDRAMIIVQLTGVAQWSDAKVNEELNRLQRELSYHYASIEWVKKWRSIDAVVSQHPMVQMFMERLRSDESLDDNVRRLAIALGLNAFDRAMTLGRR